MNFLAHSLLGFDNTDLIAGQFCGDFVRGSELKRFPPGIEQGIRLHRHLDVFTDSYPALIAARQDMAVVPRRFAGIVVDVLFDHYLANHWQKVSAISLDMHVQRVHAALAEHWQSLPVGLQRFSVLLREQSILENNRDLSAIELTLARLSRRSERFEKLAVTQAELLPVRELLHEPFELFYSELHQAAVSYLSNNPARESSL